MNTCSECGHSGDDFEQSDSDAGPVVVCPSCDWYGPAEEAGSSDS